MRIAVCLLACAATLGAQELFRDDFSRFPAGWFSTPVGTLNAAIQEYHYLAHRGVPTAPWANPISHHDGWLAGDENGKPYIEQHLVNELAARFHPLFITGEPEWSDYTVEASVKPLSPDDMAGVVFRYRTNRHHYVFALTGGNRARLALALSEGKRMRVAEWKELGTAEFVYDSKRYHRLKVANRGSRIECYVDGRLLITAEDSEILAGKAGLTANIPARFQDFLVTAADAPGIRARIAAREAELARLRRENPAPRLWRKLETPNFGVGRNLRLGDLDGDGRPDLLLVQNIQRVRGDAFTQISCLTALTLEGKILWQQGKPDARNGLLTNDNPVQIHDLDGDGAAEVVLVRDFQLQVLEGRTGKLLRSAWMPEMDPTLKERPYRYNSGDAIAFINLSGRKHAGEILVKDRYKYFWVFNDKLEMLWKGEGQTGHYPYAWDIDGDGNEEFALGYALYSSAGKLLWSYDEKLRDHADGIVIGNFSPDERAAPRVYACGSDEGYLMFSNDGKLLRQTQIGHAQSPSVAKYRSDTPGLQLLTINFWYNPGIISLFDWQGNLLEQAEPIHSGSPVLPVNWRGDGIEYALLSGNPREGGMIDGRLRRVVMFPADGHPDLAAHVTNLTGDERDEVMLWDTRSIWIYTQDRPFSGARIYAPRRNPDYNESNYRTTVSLPAWKERR